MALVLLLVLVLVLVLVVAAVIGVVAAMARSKANRDRSNQLVVGQPTSAPASWAGSHDPEARLHRRLRDALAALDASAPLDVTGVSIETRVELQQAALRIDEQLVATAAMALYLRREPLERLSEAVTSLEQAIAELTNRSVAESAIKTTKLLAEVRSNTELAAEARAEVERLGDGSVLPPVMPAPQVQAQPAPATTPPVLPPPTAGGETSPPSGAPT